MNAVDTNILIYARDPRDPAKRMAAGTLLSSLTDGVLLWQVACEYISASRKLEQFGFDREQALADVADMRESWQTILPAWNIMDRAVQLMTKY